MKIATKINFNKKIKSPLLGLFLVFFFFGFSQSIYAKAFDPQVSIPGSDFTRGASSITVNDTTNALALYIKAVYNYAISIVGIVATIMLMFGGFVWLTAGGSGDKVGKARDIIFGSLTGLVLALTSYTLLSMINTDLVNFKVLRIDGVTDTGGLTTCLKNSSGGFYCESGDECNPKTLTCRDFPELQIVGCCLYGLVSNAERSNCEITTFAECNNKSNDSFYPNQTCQNGQTYKKCGPLNNSGVD